MPYMHTEDVTPKPDLSQPIEKIRRSNVPGMFTVYFMDGQEFVVDGDDLIDAKAGEPA